TQHSPNTDQHKHPNPPRRTKEVQCETNGFALGARGGIFSTSTPAAMNSASNAPVNFASRSRSRNRRGSARSARSISGLRAAWLTHAPVGCEVTPARCTLRRSNSITNSTYTIQLSPVADSVCAGEPEAQCEGIRPHAKGESPSSGGLDGPTRGAVPDHGQSV